MGRSIHSFNKPITEWEGAKCAWHDRIRFYLQRSKQFAIKITGVSFSLRSSERIKKNCLVTSNPEFFKNNSEALPSTVRESEALLGKL
jgi:hypothetical protein